MSKEAPVVVIVGGGFGGLAAARALKHAPVKVILIDRVNHNLFQPLLYQVATSVLSPGQIGAPIRGIIGSYPNTTVLLGEVTGVDMSGRSVFVTKESGTQVTMAYDYLILATGVEQSYFGHEQFRKYAPGMKTLADAVFVRNKILLALEKAEAEDDYAQRAELLTFAIVGAGPTGVEMSSAIAVMIQSRLRNNFRRVGPMSTRIVLIDGASGPLGTFAPELSEAARKRLHDLGVETMFGHNVDEINERGVVIAGQQILSKTVIWTAGVAPSPAGKWLQTETDRAGRVRVGVDLTVKNHPEILVVGDTASKDQDGKPLPGVAQVAMQQGQYAANLIRNRIAGKSFEKPFRYFDKGNLAVVGKGFAVLESGKVRLSGLLAWLVWALIHIQFLAQARLRLSVFVQWVWTYFTDQRGSPLIVKHHADEN
jgi:NADH dehydrogenase FAD-containing subunit